MLFIKNYHDIMSMSNKYAVWIPTQSSSYYLLDNRKYEDILLINNGNHAFWGRLKKKSSGRSQQPDLLQKPVLFSLISDTDYANEDTGKPPEAPTLPVSMLFEIV